jgi:methylenetetrahydrofolate--tRNA-(uracil-5-)-methyltransferase
MCYYITNADAKKFQPMNVNFGLLPPLEKKIRDKKEKNRTLAERALKSLDAFWQTI